MKTLEVKQNGAIVELTDEELKWLLFLTDASICVSCGDRKEDFTVNKIDSLIESAIYNQKKLNQLEKQGFRRSLSIHDSITLHNNIKYLVDTIKHKECKE